jgi:hypothetical protein
VYVKHTLAPLLLAIAALSSCGSGSQTGARIHESLERLIPPDTIGLVGLRLADMRSSPLYDRYIARQQFGVLDRFMDVTGLDARRDLDELLLAVDGNNTVAMIRGKFRQVELERKLTEAGASAIMHNGRKLFTQDAGQGAVAVVDSSLGVAGPEALVRATLDRIAKPSRMPEPLAKLVRAVPQSHQAWAVTIGGLPKLNVNEKSNLANLERAINGVQSAIASADISRGLSLSVNATYANEGDARQVHGAARGLLALGRLSAPKDRPDVLAFYDAFQIRLDAATLRIDAEVPRDTLDNTLRQLDRYLRPR